MKKLVITISIILALVFMFSVCACSCNKENKEANAQTEESVAPTVSPLWIDAIYVDNQTLGEGSKSFTFIQKVATGTLTLTIKTDEEFLGDALKENDILSEEGSTLYKTVNGITVEDDNHYWILLINDSFAPTGFDDTKIEDGAVYTVEYQTSE